MSHNNLGYAYVKLAETNTSTPAAELLLKAVPEYKEALRLNPNYAKALNNLGSVYNKTGQYRDAVEPLKKAIQLKADFPEAHYNLGTAFYRQSQFAEAVAALQAAIRLKPDYIEALNTLELPFSPRSFGRVCRVLQESLDVDS